MNDQIDNNHNKTKLGTSNHGRPRKFLRAMAVITIAEQRLIAPSVDGKHSKYVTKRNFRLANKKKQTYLTQKNCSYSR